MDETEGPLPLPVRYRCDKCLKRIKVSKQAVRVNGPCSAMYLLRVALTET
jgi:hypothetical protein